MTVGHSAPVLVVLAGGKARRYGGCKPLAPVGPAGEPMIDMVASDALSAGFGALVLVVGASTGPAIRYHVARRWPEAVDVHFAVQPAARGTVDAVLAAQGHVPAGDPFGVANADDLYGIEALRLLAGHLTTGSPDSALVGFRLASATIGRAPVTRGICALDGAGMLTRIDERRQVIPMPEGRFVAGDGRKPTELSADALVSMNLWGFTPSIWSRLHEAMAKGLAVDRSAEVLLPEMVGRLVTEKGPDALAFRVLPTDSRCVGVTHPDDLGLVQADIAAQVGRGDRPAQLWSAVATAAAVG